MTILFTHKNTQKGYRFKSRTDIIEDAEEVLLWCRKSFGHELAVNPRNSWSYFMNRTVITRASHRMDFFRTKFKKGGGGTDHDFYYDLTITIPNESEALLFTVQWASVQSTVK